MSCLCCDFEPNSGLPRMPIDFDGSIGLEYEEIDGKIYLVCFQDDSVLFSTDVTSHFCTVCGAPFI